MLVRVQGDLLRQEQQLCSLHPWASTGVQQLCGAHGANPTSSLNWLLSHMDLKLLLFSKSVIFIFNWTG